MSKFLSALAADGALDDASLSEAELDRLFSPLREQVTESLQRQETLLYNIEVSWAHNLYSVHTMHKLSR